MDAKTSTLLKQVEVPGYDKSQYTSERIWATASDGTKIPVSIVYKKSVDPHSGGNPLWLTAYGSASSSSKPPTRPPRPTPPPRRRGSAPRPVPRRRDTGRGGHPKS